MCYRIGERRLYDTQTNYVIHLGGSEGAIVVATHLTSLQSSNLTTTAGPHDPLR